MSQSKTSQKGLNTVERQRQALELRKAGKGFQAIADQLGYSDASGAYRAVTAALQKTLQEPADDLRRMELERLDALHGVLWAQAQDGDQGAVDRLLRVMERRARLLGLDAPTKIAPTDPTGQEEYGNDIKQQLISRFASIATTDTETPVSQ